ncbi:MAG TPA: EAL domain-containing protein, partial [Telluria sp.]
KAMHSHGPHAHLVQFYENDVFLITGLADFIGAALTGGDKGIVIATRSHLDMLEQALVQRGLLDGGHEGNYIPIDANHMLPLFMANGLPDQARFHHEIGNIVIKASDAHEGDVYIFGEMVALLCAGEHCHVHTVGKHQAAIHVENYFNELQQHHPFTLLCAYPLSAFPHEDDRAMFGEVCRLHTEVLPAENLDLDADPDTVRRTIALLQQQAYALSTEVYDRKQVERALREVNFDRLTGLPNRGVFHDRMEMDIKRSRRTGRPVALLFIDLDHFKEINDTLGHATGDELLKQVGQRLASYVRAIDTVTRLGGDEFTITLAELKDIPTVTDVAQKILEDLARPFQLGDEVAYVSASIGITLYPADASSVGELLRNADQAMYESKALGRNRFCYFTRSMQEAAQIRMAMSNDLRQAMSAQQLTVFYQPIVDMKAGRIVKAEALLRWRHPENGEISPVDFIPIAEHTGMIVGIGNWVFQQALTQSGQWRALQPDFTVSVNVSPVQFYRSNETYYRQWLSDCKTVGGVPGVGPAVSIEITEGLMMAADETVMDKLNAFQNAGIKILLDDFGTGYSSLSYLRKFNLDYLKIDQSFVHNLEQDSANCALCEAIIVMAHKLGLKVIAEGIETPGQRDMLASAGCDFGQGYLFGPPVGAEDFERLLRSAPPQRSGQSLPA